jgi:hypothetical protein
VVKSVSADLAAVVVPVATAMVATVAATRRVERRAVLPASLLLLSVVVSAVAVVLPLLKSLTRRKIQCGGIYLLSQIAQ